jgi:hypothetical protein
MGPISPDFNLVNIILPKNHFFENNFDPFLVFDLSKHKALTADISEYLQFGRNHTDEDYFLILRVPWCSQREIMNLFQTFLEVMFDRIGIQFKSKYKNLTLVISYEREESFYEMKSYADTPENNILFLEMSKVVAKLQLNNTFKQVCLAVGESLTDLGVDEIQFKN